MLYVSSFTMMAIGSELLSSKDTGSSNRLDLLLSLAGEETGLHDDWLLWEGSLSKNLEIPCSGTVNNRCLGSLTSVLHPSLFRDKGPQLINIDAVAMLATSVSTTSGMLPVLPNPTVSMR